MAATAQVPLLGRRHLLSNASDMQAYFDCRLSVASASQQHSQIRAEYISLEVLRSTFSLVPPRRETPVVDGRKVANNITQPHLVSEFSMAGGKYTETQLAMGAGITYTRDFEVFEMNDFSGGKSAAQFATTTTSYVSATPRITRSKNNLSLGRRWLDSFKRVPGLPIGSHRGYHHNDGMPNPARVGERFYDLRAANTRTANSALARDLKSRHLQMIAIGGSIGAFTLLPTHGRCG